MISPPLLCGRIRRSSNSSWIRRSMRLDFRVYAMLTSAASCVRKPPCRYIGPTWPMKQRCLNDTQIMSVDTPPPHEAAPRAAPPLLRPQAISHNYANAPVRVRRVACVARHSTARLSDGGPEMKKTIPKATTPLRALTKHQLAIATGGLGALKGPGGPPDPGPIG
jgi:hypothetical protein